MVSKVNPIPPDLVKRFAAGESLRELGAERGVSRMKIYRWLLGELGEAEYREVVTDCLIARIAEADEKLEEAKDKVEVAKWREIARFYRMDYERRRPALYGVKQEVRHTGVQPSFTVVLLEKPSAVGGGVVLEHSPGVPALPAVEEEESEMSEIVEELTQGEDDEQEGHAGQAVAAG